jgi:hypothetical protein
MIKRIVPPELSVLVTGWSEHVYIEVRACEHCGRQIAVKREVVTA